MFSSYEQNDSARLLPIAKFAYNNLKNISMYYISLILNCGNNLYLLYKY